MTRFSEMSFRVLLPPNVIMVKVKFICDAPNNKEIIEHFSSNKNNHTAGHIQSFALFLQQKELPVNDVNSEVGGLSIVMRTLCLERRVSQNVQHMKPKLPV